MPDTDHPASEPRRRSALPIARAHGGLPVALNLLVLIALCVAVAVYGTSKENGTRVRNSFIVDTAPLDAFRLRPDELPATFRHESRPAPAYLQTVVGRLIPPASRPTTGEFEQGLVLARHLIENKRKGKAIQRNVRETYALIRDAGRGYCADYSQVFTALALAANLDVREWGLGFDGFGRGHAFNEVFDSTRDKWVFIDSFHSLYVVDRGTQEPLSTIEFQQRLIADGRMSSYAFVPIVPEKYRFRSDAEANDYYARSAQNLYLFWANDVFTYDTHPIVRTLAPVSRALEVMGAIALGVHPTIRVLELPGNAQYLDRLRHVKITLLCALAAVSVLGIVLLFQVVSAVRRRRRV